MPLLFAASRQRPFVIPDDIPSNLTILYCIQE